MKYYLQSNYNPEIAVLEIAQQIVENDKFRRDSLFGYPSPDINQALEFTRGMFRGNFAILLAKVDHQTIGFLTIDDHSPRDRSARAHIHFFKWSKYIPKLLSDFLITCKQDYKIQCLRFETPADHDTIKKGLKKWGCTYIGDIPKLYDHIDGSVFYKIL